jgi:hypothetical protein
MTIEQKLSTPLAYIESAGVSLPEARRRIAECIRLLCKEIEALKKDERPA